MKKIVLIFALFVPYFKAEAGKLDYNNTKYTPSETVCKQALAILIRLTTELDMVVTGEARSKLLQEIHNISPLIRQCKDEGFID